VLVAVESGIEKIRFHQSDAVGLECGFLSQIIDLFLEGIETYISTSISNSSIHSNRIWWVAMVDRDLLPKTDPSLSWEADISVLNNWRVWSDIAKIWLIVAICSIIALGIPLGAAGAWDAVGLFAIFAIVATGCLLIVGAILLAVITGNRFRLKYDFDENGVTCTVTDPRARMIGRGTFLAGLAAGSLATTSTGMVTISGEEREAFWSRIKSAKFDPRRRTIDLRGSWRSLLVVYCPAELYDKIARLVEDRISDASHSDSYQAGSSLPKLLLWSVYVVAACLPLFALPYPFEMDLLIPILLLCFAVACVWFLPPLGYFVLLGVAGAVFQIASVGVQNFGSFGYGRLSVDAWGLQIGAAAIGLLFLTWFAIRTIRGNGPSALYHDITEP